MSMMNWEKPGPVKVKEVPVDPQPTVSWVALTQPSALRYNGTTVQAVHAALRKAFGPFPIKLRTEDQDLHILRGLVAGAGEGHTPFDILYDALEKFGEIEIRDK